MGCTVGGDCSDTGGRPIFQLVTDAYGWPYAVAYCIIMSAMTFGLFNVIVAMFVENTMAAAKFNDNKVKIERLHDREHFALKSAELVERIMMKVGCAIIQDDDDDTGKAEAAAQLELSPEQFGDLVWDKDIRQILNDLDVDESNLLDLFDVLDSDGGGTLQVDEIVMGIYKLRGDARRSDIINVGLLVRSVQRSLFDFQDSVMAHLEALNPAVSWQLKNSVAISRHASING